MWWYFALWDKEFSHVKLYLSKLVCESHVSAESNRGTFRDWKGCYFIDVVYRNPFQEFKLSAVIIIFFRSSSKSISSFIFITRKGRTFCSPKCWSFYTCILLESMDFCSSKFCTWLRYFQSWMCTKIGLLTSKLIDSELYFAME